MREQLDSYGRVGVGALLGAAVAALLYGGMAYGNENPVDLARHPGVEPVQTDGSGQVEITSVDAASVTEAADGGPISSTTTVSATSSTTTTASATTTTTTAAAHTTTTIYQPPPTTTTEPPPPPPPPPTTTTKTKPPCHWIIC